MIAYTNYLQDGRVSREAETLVAHGFHVRCFTSGHGAPASRRVINGVELIELNVRKYRGKSTLSYIAAYLRFLLQVSARCLSLLLKKEIDVVHVHNLPNFLAFAGLIPRLLGRRVVLDMHDTAPETFATKFSQRGLVHRLLFVEERISAFIADSVICVNHPQRDAVVSRGIPAAKTFVSMNVPNPRVFSHPIAPRRRETVGSSTNLVYHGTMAERLGVDLVIRAVALLRERGVKVRLHLWGHGDDLGAFQELVRALRLDEMVEFEPEGYPHRELPYRLEAMQIGVVGNRRSDASELMLPVKMIEYAAVGIPSVAPRLKTIQHYFSDDMVAYYQPEDVRSLCDALAGLCGDPERQLRQARHAKAFLDRYGWEQQEPDFVKLYEQLVQRRSA